MDAVEARPKIGIAFWAFIVLMLGLTALWIVLGIWQINRLAWKEGLIAEVSTRMGATPVDLPSVAQWTTADLGALSYRPVKLSGQYDAAKTVLVFTDLSDPKGPASGPGYWVMTPFTLEAGGTAFVDRGFIPQARARDFAAGQGSPMGPQAINAIALDAEPVGAFTPAPDTAQHIEWVRDPVRLARLANVTGPVFGMTFDAPATAPGALPQGGETVVDFPNNHFGYALTWFGFAILTPSLLAFWVWRQLRPRPA